MGGSLPVCLMQLTFLEVLSVNCLTELACQCVCLSVRLSVCLSVSQSLPCAINTVCRNHSFISIMNHGRQREEKKKENKSGICLWHSRSINLAAHACQPLATDVNNCQTPWQRVYAFHHIRVGSRGLPKNYSIKPEFNALIIFVYALLICRLDISTLLENKTGKKIPILRIFNKAGYFTNLFSLVLKINIWMGSLKSFWSKQKKANMS
jgi:hypothetical protein